MTEERKSRYELFLEEEARKAQPTKRCSKCGETKALSEFHKHPSSPQGVRARCKKCVNKGARYKSRADLFWKHYHRSVVRVGDCIEWTGSYKSDGYPSYNWRESDNTKYKQIAVGRLVYILAIGNVSDEDVVLLSCDNRRCVRHSHLVLATKEQREAKRQNKAATGKSHGRYKKPERTARGERHANAKLSTEKIHDIRVRHEHGETGIQIAESLGVSVSAVSRVVRRQSWAHVQ